MHFILLILCFFKTLSDHVKVIENDHIEEWVNKERISVVLLLDKSYDSNAKLKKAWDDTAEIFDDFASFAVSVVSTKLPAAYKAAKYPAVKIVRKESQTPTAYNGPITVEDLVPHILGLMDKSVRDKFKSKGYSQRDSFVEELNEKNFDSAVTDSEDHYLVEFFAPWCGHCKALAPAWKEAAKQLNGKMKLAAVDATVNNDLARRFDVKGFPTIKFIPAHSKDPQKSATDYSGGRSVDQIVQWAETKLRSLVPPPDVVQLTNQDQLDTSCFSKAICVLTFVPNRLDSSSEDWNKYIAELKSTVMAFKSNNWGWFWVEGGVYEQLESSVGVGGFGYPALIAINHNKKAFSVMKSSFAKPQIVTFLNSLGSKSIVTDKLPDSIAPIAETQKWDGKSFSNSEL